MAEWRCSSIIPDLVTRWRVGSFTFWLLYLWGKNPRYPLDSRMDVSQGRSIRFGVVKNILTRRYTDWDTCFRFHSLNENIVKYVLTPMRSMVKCCYCKIINVEILEMYRCFWTTEMEKVVFVIPSVCLSVSRTPEESDRFQSSSIINIYPANMSFLHPYTGAFYTALETKNLKFYRKALPWFWLKSVFYGKIFPDFFRLVIVWIEFYLYINAVNPNNHNGIKTTYPHPGLDHKTHLLWSGSSDFDYISPVWNIHSPK
jgi:hypothetical protein